MSDGLDISAATTIPRSELVVRATRSGGPGGQHVNTSSTRVEVLWNVRETRALDQDQRRRVIDKLASRIDDQGFIRVVASDTRSQRRNREAAESRLAELVRKALVVPRRRVRTKPPPRAHEARIETKKRRGKLKVQRRTRD
ncbi:MAG: alternative ribosome rescue aminoacyl-tRNA hydrolase ArfB [Gemmatimonadaceae bacterium]